MSKPRPAVFFPKPEPLPLTSKISHHSSSRPSLTPFLLLSPPESFPLQSSLEICHILPPIHSPSSEHKVFCFQAFSHMYSSLPKFHSCFKNLDQISHSWIPTQWDRSWLPQSSYSVSHLCHDFLHHLIHKRLWPRPNFTFQGRESSRSFSTQHELQTLWHLTPFLQAQYP